MSDVYLPLTPMASRPQQKMKDRFDESVQNQKTSVFVIPANAGIQVERVVPGFRVMTAKKPAVMPGMTALEVFARPTINRQLSYKRGWARHFKEGKRQTTTIFPLLFVREGLLAKSMPKTVPHSCSPGIKQICPMHTTTWVPTVLSHFYLKPHHMAYLPGKQPLSRNAPRTAHIGKPHQTYTINRCTCVEWPPYLKEGFAGSAGMRVAVECG